MCLTRVLKDEKKADVLAELPESGYYWKVVRAGYPASYKSEFTVYTFNAGWNESGSQSYCIGASGYQAGFHAFRRKADAAFWDGPSTKTRLVRCKIQKKDIVAVGFQCLAGRKMLCIVATRVWMPKYKK